MAIAPVGQAQQIWAEAIPAIAEGVARVAARSEEVFPAVVLQSLRNLAIARGVRPRNLPFEEIISDEVGQGSRVVERGALGPYPVA